MYVDGNLVPIIGIVSGATIAIISIVIGAITKYKLQMEQIKADAMVRTEEVRAKNQLEIEKLMYREYSKENPDRPVKVEDDTDNDPYRQGRARDREKY